MNYEKFWQKTFAIDEKIWQKTLATDEKIEYKFSIGQDYIKFDLIVWGIISILLLFVGGIGILFFLFALFYYAFYLKVANAYAFMNKRVLIHHGWLSTHTISVDYSKITDVHIRESFFGRILTHTGNMAIITAGSTDDQIHLRHIEAPYEIKKKLDSLKDR